MKGVLTFIALFFSFLVCSQVSAGGLSVIEPKSACDWLAARGMKTQGWGELGGGDFGCPSVTKEFGPVSVTYEKNDIAYYVASSAGKLVELKIFLNVNNPGVARLAHDELLGAVDVLLAKLGVFGSIKLRSAIKGGDSYSYSESGYSFRLVKMPWGGNGQYSVKFVVE